MQSAVITLVLRQIGTRGLSTVSHPSAGLGAIKGLLRVAVSLGSCMSTGYRWRNSLVSPSRCKAKTDINITMKHHKGYFFIAFTSLNNISFFIIISSWPRSCAAGWLVIYFFPEGFETSFSPAELPETPLCRMHRARSACQLVVKGRRNGWGELQGMGNIRSILSCVVERGASAGPTELCKVSFFPMTFSN